MRPLVLYFSGSSPDEKEARRCMSPRLPTFARNRGAKVPPPASAHARSKTVVMGELFAEVRSPLYYA